MCLYGNNCSTTRVGPLVQFLLQANVLVSIYFEIFGKKPMAGLILQRWHDGEWVDRYICYLLTYEFVAKVRSNKVCTIGVDVMIE